MFFRVTAMMVDLRSGGPVVPGPGGDRRLEPDVFLEHVALRRERGAGAADALEIVLARPVALLDRRSRITGRLALAPGARERNRRAREDQALGLAADRGVPERPPGVASERHGD